MVKNFSCQHSPFYITMKYMTRTPIFAGSFYPNDPEELKYQINNYLESVNLDAEARKAKHVKALIVPHAGYIYSGPVAAYAYEVIKKGFCKNIYVLGLAHRHRCQGVCLADYNHWKTPLGEVSVDTKIVRRLGQNDEFTINNQAHAPEHSVEVQLPFLQEVLSRFDLVPMVVGGGCDLDLINEVASILAYTITENDLLIISTDFSHYLSYEQAVETDKKTISAIKNLSIEDIHHEDACCSVGIKILLTMAKDLDWSPILLDYRNSGDIVGNKVRVVGYSSFAFVKD